MDIWLGLLSIAVGTLQLVSNYRRMKMSADMTVEKFVRMRFVASGVILLVFGIFLLLRAAFTS